MKIAIVHAGLVLSMVAGAPNSGAQEMIPGLNGFSAHLDCEDRSLKSLVRLNDAANSDLFADLKPLKALLRDCPSWELLRAMQTFLHGDERMDNDELMDRLEIFPARSLTTYRIGKVWTKSPVTPARLSAEPELEVASGSLLHSFATSFFLGIVGGAPIFATNAHVFNDPKACENLWLDQARLPTPDHLRCERLVGRWPEVELALYTTNGFSPEQAEYFRHHRLRFDFAKTRLKNHPLLTVGFGVYRMKYIGQNHLGHGSHWWPAADTSDNCILGVDIADVHRMEDPDHLQPNAYATWAVPMGCGFSPEDSGSPVLDRHTLRVIGVAYTSASPKPRDLPPYLAMSEADRWAYSSFMTPAWKIAETLRQAEADASLSDQARAIIRFVLSGGVPSAENPN